MVSVNGFDTLLLIVRISKNERDEIKSSTSLNQVNFIFYHNRYSNDKLRAHGPKTS